MSTEREPLTDDQVREIRARVDAATPGPWKTGGRCVLFARVGPSSEGDYLAPYGVSISGEMVPAGGFLPVDECDGTAEFIAAARQDVPDLCRDLLDARATIAQHAIGEVDTSEAGLDKCRAAIDAARGAE